MNNEASQKLQTAGGAEREARELVARNLLTNRHCMVGRNAHAPSEVICYCGAISLGTQAHFKHEDEERTKEIVAALEKCANEARLEEAVDWLDAAVSLTRSAHEKWMEARIVELRRALKAAHAVAGDTDAT